MLKVKSYLVSDLILNNEASGDVTPLKLIKLVYICHGFHLAVMHDSLIEEHVEAWQYGPVVVGVYDAVRDFRGQPIDRDLFAPYSVYPKYKGLLTDDAKTVIDKVLQVYGKHDGLALSSMTHKKGTPWHTVANREGLGNIIPNELIYEYYKPKVNRNA